MGDFKALHDCLHTLQLKCYYPLTSIRQNIVKPEPKTKLRMKKQLGVVFELELSSVIDELEKVFNQQRLLKGDFSWVESIEKLWELLNEVLKLLEDDLIDYNPEILEKVIVNMDEGIVELGSVLRIQPSSINSLLIRSIRDLNLSSLYITLQNIKGVLLENGAQENQLVFFKNGIDNLIKLDNELNKQIREHSLWQKVDADLQFMDDKMKAGLKIDVKKNCKVLDQGVLTICNESIEEGWSKRLRKFSKMLNEAMDIDDTDYITDCFSEYKAEAQQRFYAVDKSLRFLCEQIRPIGDTIRTVLDTINEYEPNNN